MSAPGYAARAAAGAAFLDEHRPGWAERIDLDQLDMSSCQRCVLGQLGGTYADAADGLGIGGDSEVQLGFMRLAGDGGYTWQLLRNAWTAEIARRREPAQAAS